MSDYLDGVIYLIFIAISAGIASHLLIKGKLPSAWVLFFTFLTVLTLNLCKVDLSYGWCLESPRELIIVRNSNEEYMRNRPYMYFNGDINLIIGRRDIRGLSSKLSLRKCTSDELDLVNQ